FRIVDCGLSILRNSILARTPIPQSAICNPNYVVWNGTDDNSRPVGSGIYFYSLKIDNKTVSTKKCLLIK
ncbi:MAG: hypothetical protein KAT74_05695, partial [Candidatus Cloacimonetes bacterium]|nr:hypothetical protein [Candidatus Cloacimonadota bacterium]